MSDVEAIQVPMDDVVDLIVVEPGEYKVRLLGITSGVDKNGNDYLLPRLEVENEPYSKDFTYFLGLPNDGDDAKQKNRKKLAYRDFMLAFGLDPAEAHVLSDLEGLTAWAILGKKDDENYGLQNYIKSWVKAA